VTVTLRDSRKIFENGKEECKQVGEARFGSQGQWTKVGVRKRDREVADGRK